MYKISTFCVFFSLCIALDAFIIIDQPIHVDIKKEFLKAGIVPKVIPTAPTQLFDIWLPSGKLVPGSLQYHELGEEHPGVMFNADNSTWNAIFSVVVYNWDPEEKIASRSPNSTTHKVMQREWHQWIRVNIPGNDYLLGKDYYSFVPPDHDTSLEIVDLHLYLVYRQPGKLNFKRPYEMWGHNHSIIETVNEFTKYYNMTGPFAGNFHYSYWCH